MRSRLVGPSLYFCTSFYGESKIIGRVIAPPTLPEPTPMSCIIREPDSNFNLLNEKYRCDPLNVDIEYSLYSFQPTYVDYVLYYFSYPNTSQPLDQRNCTDPRMYCTMFPVDNKYIQLTIKSSKLYSRFCLWHSVGHLFATVTYYMSQIFKPTPLTRLVLLDRLVTSRQEEVNRDQSLKVLEERRGSLNNELVSLNKQVQQAVYKRDSELGKKNAHVSFRYH